MKTLDKIRKLYAELSAEEQREFKKMLDVEEKPPLREAPRRRGNYIPMKPGLVSKPVGSEPGKTEEEGA